VRAFRIIIRALNESSLVIGKKNLMILDLVLDRDLGKRGLGAAGIFRSQAQPILEGMIHTPENQAGIRSLHLSSIPLPNAAATLICANFKAERIQQLAVRLKPGVD
jgi:hypothetical protein